MSSPVQILVVAGILAVCVAVVAWQFVQFWRGHRAGNCGICRGCRPKDQTKKTVFLPSEFLSRHK